jgi:hypothetical protein
MRLRPAPASDTLRAMRALLLSCLLALAASTATPASAQSGEGRRGASKGPPATTRPAPAARASEFRFDALRIDGQLHGPAALEVRALTRASRAPLLRLRRSFVHRIFETVEAPGLHGR